MKPGMGPGAFHRESESVVRQLQAGHTVTVEMKIRTSDRMGHARSVGILERLVSLAEGVGEVQLLDIGERVRPRAQIGTHSTATVCSIERACLPKDAALIRLNWARWSVTRVYVSL